MTKLLKEVRKLFTPKVIIGSMITLVLLLVLGLWMFQLKTKTIVYGDLTLTIPDAQSSFLTELIIPENSESVNLHPYVKLLLENEREELIEARRQDQISRVKRLFNSYGSPLVGYEELIVDRSEECGADFKVIVGIAGSESGLGKINYKRYNPFGYLDGVQYPDQETALYELICKISANHLSFCGSDLQCLVNRYAGPGDNANHFVSKVQWFINQLS